MDSLIMEFKLSCYEELTKLNENKKSKIYLVRNKVDSKIYIKKVLTNYNFRIYEVLKEKNLKNIPKIYDIFEDDNALIVIEEYINGDTLKEILDREDIIKEDMVIDYIITLCDTLDKLHNLNPKVIHRDIKPSNIIISNDNILKLIDFDVSREYKENKSEDTVIQGTEEYAPPEQFGFIQTDERSDIYSTGILINVLTTGEYPKNKLNKGKLGAIIKKCTEFSPNDRYQKVIDLKEELLKIKNNSGNVLINKMSYKNKIKDKKNALKNKKDLNINEKINNLKEKVNKLIIKDKKIESQKEKEKITIKNFYKVIPGFRTGKKWKAALATLTYVFLISTFFIEKETEGVKNEILENASMVTLILLLIFLYSNFLGIKEKLPFIKSNNRIINLLGYILYSILIFIIFGLLNDMSKF